MLIRVLTGILAASQSPDRIGGSRVLQFMEFGNPLQDSCDIYSSSFGIETEPYAGGVKRQAQIHDMNFTKMPDQLSAVLFEYCGSGKQIDEVALKLYRSEESPAPYLTYLLKEVFVTSIHTSGSNNPGVLPLDQFTLAAKTITYHTS